VIWQQFSFFEAAGEATRRPASRQPATGNSVLNTDTFTTRAAEMKLPSLTLAASATWPMLPISVVNFHLPIAQINATYSSPVGMCDSISPASSSGVSTTGASSGTVVTPVSALEPQPTTATTENKNIA